VRILAIDIGTGTQDILLYDPDGPVENSPKLVMPSPTAVAARRIRAATAARRPLVISGVIAGGGPCGWAMQDHLRAGLAVYATPDAAMTFNDDLEQVRAEGVVLISDGEVRRADGEHVVLRDLDLEAVRTALRAFGADDTFEGVAVGVFDHGAAPPEISDRVYRFGYLADVLRIDPDARAFAATSSTLSPKLTRARAVLDEVEAGLQAVFMDNGPAAALGALHDPVVAASPLRAVLNVGNMHVLCFVLEGTRVRAVFEHHSGEVTPSRLAELVRSLLAGTLTNEAVFSSQGHGALYVEPGPCAVPVLAVTGPQRERMLPALREVGVPLVHPAAPHGDMMIAGCFGLLDGFAYRVAEARESVARLHQ
jgi:uncharacterized protein (DUF1786 family)